MSNSQMPKEKLDSGRDQFQSTFGFIMAAAGSALGLGSVWKFPYLVGTNGGGAYVFIYLIATFLIGIPLMIGEFALGRHAGKNAVEAYGMYNKNFKGIGIFAMLSVSLLLSYYAIIGGWTIMYLWLSITGKISGLTPDQYTETFVNYSSNMGVAGLFAAIFMIITILVVMKGVTGGIEKACSIMMPVLAVILVIMTIRGITLPGAMEGVKWFLKPDFSKVTGSMIVFAVGQVFFTLSLGSGGLVTYASYLKKDENIPKAATITTIFDTAISFLAGFAIFPAVFAFGLEPAAGPGLVFMTLPNVFDQMPAGRIFAAIFYLLLIFAALPSAFDMIIVSVAYLEEKAHVSKAKATLLCGLIITLVGIPSLLSFGPWSDKLIAGKTIFDAADYFVSNISMPLVGMAGSLILGFNWKKETVINEVTNDGKIQSKLVEPWYYDIKFVTPIILFLIFLQSIGVF